MQCGNAAHSRCFLGEVLQLETGLRETVLGKEHPDMLGSTNNLAWVLSDQSKCEEAEEIYRQALRLYETVLSKEHLSCQRGRRARLAIDLSTGCACVSHAFDVLGVCVMVTSALLHTETER